MAAIVIDGDLLGRLLGDAAASPDREICGLLFGGRREISAAAATANVAIDPADSFEIDPAALLIAHKAARAGGPPIIGCYHSHPSGATTPSTRDADNAEPGKLWLILAEGRARLWLAGENGFAERALNVAHRAVVSQ